MTGSAVLAVVLAGAVGAAVVHDPGASLARLRPAPAGRLTRAPVVATTALVAGAGAGLALGSWLLAATVATALLTAGRAVGARASRRRVERVRSDCADLLGALSAELRAGSEPRLALAAVCAGPVPAVAAAARSPASAPAAALSTAGRVPGAEALADLAVAWRVVEATGGPLAAAVDRLAATARAETAARRELAAQLAGPRATAVLLSLLPVAGVLLGSALGADPLGFLLGTGAGRGCLLAGTVLVAAGTAWTEALAGRAEHG